MGDGLYGHRVGVLTEQKDAPALGPNCGVLARIRS